jgi:hypothetical protein
MSMRAIALGICWPVTSIVRMLTPVARPTVKGLGASQGLLSMPEPRERTSSPLKKTRQKLSQMTEAVKLSSSGQP